MYNFVTNTCYNNHVNKIKSTASKRKKELKMTHEIRNIENKMTVKEAIDEIIKLYGEPKTEVSINYNFRVENETELPCGQKVYYSAEYDMVDNKVLKNLAKSFDFAFLGNGKLCAVVVNF